MSDRRLPNSQKFPRSRAKCWVALVVSTGLLAYAAYFVFGVGLNAATAEYARGLSIYSCCVLALPILGILIATLTRAVLKRDNGLVIDEQGVHDQLSFNGKIHWSNIISVQLLRPNSKSSSFALRLRDRSTYLRHSWTKHFAARGDDEVMIYGFGLSSAAEILAAIEAGIRANASNRNSA